MATRLLTLREVADRTGLALKSVRAWAAQRRHLPTVRLGRAVRVREADLEAWLTAHTEPPRRDLER